VVRNALPPLSLALTALRSALNWTQAELARAAGVRPYVISDYECGQRALQRDRLEELVGYMGLLSEAVTRARDFIRLISLRARLAETYDDAVAPEHRQIEAIATRTGKLYAELTRSLLSQLLFEGRTLSARQQAAALWQRLQQRSPTEQRLLVEESTELQSWAFCELLCKESIKVAADSAVRACELADLALFIARVMSGEAAWRQRLQSYAWAHVGNARRVRGDLPTAEAAFVRSASLREAGMSENPEPGLLEEARVLSLEASLKTEQGRFQEAGMLLDRALVSASEALRFSLLLMKGRLLEWAGDHEGALAMIGEVALRAPLRKDPKLLLIVRHNYAWCLTYVERHAEAAMLLPEIQGLAARTFPQGGSLVSLRLRWLECRIEVGLGRSEEAESKLRQLHAEFVSRGIEYDAALVNLELAALYEKQGRMTESKALTLQVAPIIEAQGVEREL
jgi:transcriptional regulator with XRE-family HTH domain